MRSSKGILAIVSVLLLYGRNDAPAEALTGHDSMFRGNPQHTGTYVTKAARRFEAVKWKFNANGPVRSSPTLDDDRIYIGSGDGHLYALVKETGEEIWRFKTQGAVHSSPAIKGDLIYFSSRDGGLYAINLAGQQEWRFQTGSRLPHPVRHDWYLSSPAVVEGVVYCGSGDGRLYALSANTGDLFWSFQTEGRVRSSPAVYDGVVYVGSMDGRLYAVDSKSGGLVWKFDTAGTSQEYLQKSWDATSVTSSPSIAEGIATFGGRDGMHYAVDIRTGKEVWRYDHHGHWVSSTPAIFNGLVFTGNSNGRYFHVVDLLSGKEKWRYTTAAIQGSGAVADGVVYFGDMDGILYALDADSGKEKWRFRTQETILSSPVVESVTVYIGSDDGFLYALSGATEEDPTRVAPRKAVYWEENSGSVFFQGSEQVRDFFRAEGYEVLDGQALAQFMQAQKIDPTPSVVVFARDKVPQSVVSDTSESALIRQYLEFGGKIVWLGEIPLRAVIRDKETGAWQGIDITLANRILGVDHTKWDGATYRMATTETGIRWGLSGWSLSGLAVDVDEVTHVLGLDEFGRAGAWVKNYGGPEGSGFVRLWGRVDMIPDLATVKAVAEYGFD